MFQRFCFHQLKKKFLTSNALLVERPSVARGIRLRAKMEAEGVEIVHRSKNGEEETKEIVLNNGAKIFVHAEKAYDDFYPDGKSFDEMTDSGEKILFSHDAKLHRDGIKQLVEAGQETMPRIACNPMMIHHQHVMWIYQLAIERREEQCRVWVESIGPSFNTKGATKKGAIGNNQPRNQVAPKAELSCAIVLEDGTCQPIEMVKEGDGFKSKKTIPQKMLQQLVENATVAKIRMKMTVSKDYFELKNLVETMPDRPVVLPEAERLLAIVLKGEKAPGSDWVITVGENGKGQPREFFVHGKVLAHGSPILEVAMRTHSSIGNDQQLLMISHENRFILPQTHADDMPAILTYFYLRTFILPPYRAFARVGRTLCTLLPRFSIGNMFVFWEEALIREAQSLDRKDYKKTIPQLARLLVGLYSSPYGAMPAAKKVMISTLADAWHMADTSGVDLEKEFQKEEVFTLDVLAPAYDTMNRFLLVAASVKKTYI